MIVQSKIEWLLEILRDEDGILSSARVKALASVTIGLLAFLAGLVFLAFGAQAAAENFCLPVIAISFGSGSVSMVAAQIKAAIKGRK